MSFQQDMVDSTSNLYYAHKCRILLYSLLFTLVFEGLLRKLLPFLSMPIFFLKDIICIISIIFVYQLNFLNMIELKNIWLRLLLFFTPILIYTSVLDPLIAIFGLKQYLLFVVAGLLVPASFPRYNEKQFSIFCFVASLLIVPTSLVAILQNRLPGSHWLNRSVDGASLEHFASAGFLRVSSTFSFTAQYSYYLVAASFLLAIFMAKKVTKENVQFPILINAWKIILPILLMVSAFITGGRTAVVGCAALFAIGAALIASKGSLKIIRNLMILGTLVAGSYVVGTQFFPQLFAAYESRSKGSSKISHNEEIADRVLENFTSWTEWFLVQDIPAKIFGNGIGVMSNGADKISGYARAIRTTGIWTETDVATTAWEGGIYLLLIWYAMRIGIIYFSFSIWRKLKHKRWQNAGAFTFAYILIFGLTGTLGIQPPLAIWWWLAVGFMVAFSGFDKEEENQEFSTQHSI